MARPTPATAPASAAFGNNLEYFRGLKERGGVIANSYTFTADKTVTIGAATKKTDHDLVAANTDYLKEALDTIMSSSAADGVVTASGLAIDTTTLVVDAANNRVGIGTAAPDITTHILSGATQRSLLLETTDATGKQLVFQASGTTGNTNVMMGSVGDELAIYTGVSGNEMVRVDASGNVGIGTASFGTSAAGVLAIANGTQGAALANAIQIVSEDLSAGNTIPSIRTEGGGIYSAGTPAAATGSIAIKIDGTVYYFTVSTTAAS